MNVHVMEAASATGASCAPHVHLASMLQVHGMPACSRCSAHAKSAGMAHACRTSTGPMCHALATKRLMRVVQTAAAAIQGSTLQPMACCALAWASRIQQQESAELAGQHAQMAIT